MRSTSHTSSTGLSLPLLSDVVDREPYVGSTPSNTSSGVIRKRANIIFLTLLGASIVAVVWTDSLPAPQRLLQAMKWLWIGVGGLVAMIIFVSVCSRAALLCGNRKIVTASYLEQKEADLEAQRAFIERQERAREYARDLLQLRGINLEELIPLEEAKENYTRAAQRYASGDAAALNEVERWDRILEAHPDSKAERAQEAAMWIASQVRKFSQQMFAQ